MHRFHFASLFLLSLLFISALAQTKLSDVTSSIIGADSSGIVGGFASLSTGQKIDIMVIDKTGELF